jgi:hypothetical protein
MEPIKANKTIILQPQVLEILPSFDNLIRNGRYIDCVSYEIGALYMEIEAVDQPHQLTSSKILIPHGLILAVVDFRTEKSKVGFRHTGENKEEDCR